MAVPQPTGEEYRLMVSGEPYLSEDPELVDLRLRARSLVHEFNHTHPQQGNLRQALLAELFGSVAGTCTIESGLHVDYGMHIHIGAGFYANANCVMLDVAPIRIGDGTMFGPAVQLLTATHPIDPVARTSGRESGAPITIGNRVWLAGGVIVGPGVTIGDDTVVGAGSVVVHDLPARVVAVGSPARVVRPV